MEPPASQPIKGGILFIFSLPHSLGPQVAPTVTGFRPPGSQAVYTAHSPDGYPFQDAVSPHDRYG